MRPARLLGHQVHPMFIVSLGLLGAAVVVDLLYLVGNDRGLAVVSYWNMSAGLIGGLHAAVFGLWDWLAIRPRTRAKAIELWHGSISVVVLMLFATSWWIRGADFHYVPSASALALSFIAFVLVLVAGWLDGELVQRLGAGVNRKAGVDVAGSLRGRPREATGAALGAGNPPRR